MPTRAECRYTGRTSQTVAVESEEVKLPSNLAASSLNWITDNQHEQQIWSPSKSR